MFAPLSGEIMFESCVWCMKDAKMECSTKKGTEHHKESTPTKKEYEVTTGLKAHEPLQWGQVQKKSEVAQMQFLIMLVSNWMTNYSWMQQKIHKFDAINKQLFQWLD